MTETAARGRQQPLTPPTWAGQSSPAIPQAIRNNMSRVLLADIAALVPALRP